MAVVTRLCIEFTFELFRDDNLVGIPHYPRWTIRSATKNSNAVWSSFRLVSWNRRDFDLFISFVRIAQNLPTEGEEITFSPTNDQKLAFYSLYKQATIGPCNVPKPPMYQVS